MTDREERLLLSLLDEQLKNAAMVAKRWQDEPERDAADTEAVLALETERYYSMGFSTGAGHIAATVRNAING